MNFEQSKIWKPVFVTVAGATLLALLAQLWA
jgi:hypothetical protein